MVEYYYIILRKKIIFMREDDFALLSAQTFLDAFCLIIKEKG